MNETFETLNQANSEATPNVISSPASEFGPTHSDKLDGLMTDPFGREVAPANLSARQAKEQGFLTSGTFGRVGSTSSKSADLSQSLVNKLKPRLSRDGSTLFKMTWKGLVTPSGRSLSQLAASGLRTSDKEFISWPTPSATKNTKNSKDPKCMKENGVQTALADAAWLVSWITPQRKDYRSGQAKRFIEKVHAVSLNDQVMLAGWVSPTAQDHSRGTKPPRLWDKEIPLSQQVSGLAAPGSPVSTEKPGQLKPGTFPLAHGSPNRVGRLRGYGNAIVAPQAQAFIESYLEVENG